MIKTKRIALLAGVVLTCFFQPVFASVTGTQRTAKSDTFKVYYTTSLFYDVDQRDAMVAINLWTKEIGEQLNVGIIPNSRIFSSIDELMAAYLTDDIDMAVFTTQEFMQIQDKKIFEPALVGSQGDSYGEEMVLLVHRESGIRELEQLKGKELRMPVGGISSGLVMMWLETQLFERGLKMNAAFFREVIRVNKPAKAVLPVFFRQSESCIVSRRSLELLSELNPQMGSDLFVLIHSPAITRYVFCFNKNIKDGLKRLVLEKALTLDTYARGQQLLTLFKLDKVILYEPHYLDSVHQIFKRVESIRSSEGGNVSTGWAGYSRSTDEPGSLSNQSIRQNRPIKNWVAEW